MRLGIVTSDGFVAAAFNPVTIGVMEMNTVGAIFCFHYHPKGWIRKDSFCAIVISHYYLCHESEL